MRTIRRTAAFERQCKRKKADVRAPGFKAKAHRQSLAVARSPHAADDQAFIDAVSDRGPE